jgi:penicillin amidase
MPRKLKVFGIVVIVLVVIGLALWGFWSWFSRQAIPKTSGTIQVAGLSQPVEVVRDQYGVAHIYAHTPEDLFFAEGYVHAQERFWQMEFRRRLAAGRLSEIFGEATLSTDEYLRYFGFHDLAQKAYEMMEGKDRRMVDAYAAGVNAYISDRKPAKLGLEFALLGMQGVDIEIEPWTPADSLSWAEIMVFNQADILDREMVNIDLLAAVGEKMYADLNTPFRDDRPVIVPSEVMTSTGSANGPELAKLDSDEISYLLKLRGEMQEPPVIPQLLADLGFGSGGASNSFVVSGSKSSSGTPLLANDPHMAVSMPSLWYEVGMHCVEKSQDCIYNFRGFSLPGVPGILIGHNDRIAWGLTNAAFDAEDVFIERINPENPNQYEVNGKWEDMQVRREEIKVRGQDDPVVIFVRRTRNGVVATDGLIDRKNFSYDGPQPELYVLSFAWPALDPIRSAEAVLKVNGAQNWDEFVDALQIFDAGKQNWLFADVDGNIGYVLPGKIPIRAGGDGTLPVPGWNDDYRWTGFIPYDKLPRAFNPDQGFIATANNPQVRAVDYAYFLGSGQDRGQRAQRITEMIQSKQGGVSIQDMVAIQTDNQSLSALEIIPYLKELSLDDPDVAAARDRLGYWNAQMTFDSPEAALFNIFWVKLIANTFNDQLPQDLHPQGGDSTSDSVYFLLKDPANPWWDDVRTADAIEQRDAILKVAFEQAYAESVKLFGNDLGKWSWGELHTITYVNDTLGKSGISLIENIFNRGPFPTHGSNSVVVQTCWDANDPYQVACVPALRQVIDLGDLGNSLMIHAPGQSGHPKDAHYDDFIELWRTFQYHPMIWMRAEAEQGKHEVLVLESAQ